MRGARSSGRSSADRILIAGILVATCGVPLAFDPLGYNLFGAAKLFTLCAGCTVILVGLSMLPDALPSVFARGRRLLQLLLLAAFLVLTIISTATALDPMQSLVGSYPEYQGVLTFCAYLVVMAGAIVARDRDARGLATYLGRGLVVAVIAVGAVAVAQKVGFDPMDYRWNANLTRASATLGNASNLGLYLVLLLPMIVERVRMDVVAGWRLTAAGAGALGFLVLVWTSSRGAWLGLLVAIPLLVAFERWRWPPRIKARAGLGMAVLTILIVTTAVVLVPQIGQRVASSADLSGGTQLWRMSVWDSSVRATLASPALGWGPNSMRFVYPLYRNSDLSADSSDAQIVADAHNIFVNTAVERGIPAALLLAAWLSSLLISAWRQRTHAHAQTTVHAAVAIVAGVVALEFHFLTLDTGPLLFALAGVVIADALNGTMPATAVASRSAIPSRNAAMRTGDVFGRAGLWGVTALVALATVLAAGVVRADRAIGSAMSAAEAGRPWAEVSSHFESAIRSAPWEPAVPWAKGRAAIDTIRYAADPSAFEAGRSALDSASSRLRHDMRLEADIADLILTAGLAFREEKLFAEALERYRSLLARDPHNGVLWIGTGSALAGLGRWNEATAAYEQGVELAARSLPGWTNLAIAYEQVGRPDAAAAARKRVAEIADEMSALGMPPAR